MLIFAYLTKKLIIEDLK